MRPPIQRLVQSVSEHRLELPAQRGWWREWGAALLQAPVFMLAGAVAFVVTTAFLILKAIDWVSR